MGSRPGHRGGEIIKDVMEKYGIDPTQVPRRFRYQSAHGNGFLNCPECKSRWMSFYAWFNFDLRQQKIKYRFAQKCKKCKTNVRPNPTTESINNMMEIICIRYLKLISGDMPPKDQNVKPTNKPHLVDLCEKCGYGKGPPCYR